MDISQQKIISQLQRTESREGIMAVQHRVTYYRLCPCGLKMVNGIICTGAIKSGLECSNLGNYNIEKRCNSMLGMADTDHWHSGSTGSSLLLSTWKAKGVKLCSLSAAGARGTGSMSASSHPCCRARDISAS